MFFFFFWGGGGGGGVFTFIHLKNLNNFVLLLDYGDIQHLSL